MTLTLEDLIYIGLTMLLGDEDIFWEYYETDPDWWELHLWTKQN